MYIPCATLAISLAKPVETNLFSVSITRRDIPALYILPATSRISSLTKKEKEKKKRSRYKKRNKDELLDDYILGEQCKWHRLEQESRGTRRVFKRNLKWSGWRLNRTLKFYIINLAWLSWYSHHMTLPLQL